ncbi:hypothetical protein KLEB273_gp296 [Bacillus phage vB_BauM_KLEB27-3]|nr:hypothetical protein KLEB273_gp296 [Bacillus phage vB_BauM_KLEB27-3]
MRVLKRFIIHPFMLILWGLYTVVELIWAFLRYTIISGMIAIFICTFRGHRWEKKKKYPGDIKFFLPGERIECKACKMFK